MSDLVCPCGKPLRPDNTTGLCYRCQQSGRSTRTCVDCGTRISQSNQSGRCAPCYVKRHALFMAAKP